MLGAALPQSAAAKQLEELQEALAAGQHQLTQAAQAQAAVDALEEVVPPPPRPSYPCPVRRISCLSYTEVEAWT